MTEFHVVVNILFPHRNVIHISVINVECNFFFHLTYSIWDLTNQADKIEWHCMSLVYHREIFKSDSNILLFFSLE